MVRRCDSAGPSVRCATVRHGVRGFHRPDPTSNDYQLGVNYTYSLNH